MRKVGAYWNYEEVINFVNDNRKCVLLESEFENVSTKMRFRCECSEEFITTFTKFRSRNKRQCNKCGRERKANLDRLSYEHVKYFIEVESKSGCTLKTKEYINSKQKLELSCKCGNHFETDWNNFTFFKKQQCNDCSLKNRDYYRQFDYNDVLSYFKEYGEGCSVISREYINIYTPMDFKCSCGEIFTTTFQVFKNKKRKKCFSCIKNEYSEERRGFLEDVKSFIEVESKSGCKLLSTKYINNTTRLDIRCQCGNVFKVSYGTFKSSNQRRCYTCSCAVSKGEYTISEYLKGRNVEYEMEYRFEDLKYKTYLRFDFAIFDKSKKLVQLIEYDGIAHFEPINYGGISDSEAMEKLRISKVRDKMKDDYCRENNISLLRIKYSEDIEDILDKKIKN